MTEALTVDPLVPADDSVPTGIPDQRQFRDAFDVENRGRVIVNRQPLPTTDGAKTADMIRPDGTPTSNYDMLRSGQLAEQTGEIAPRDQGFRKEFGQAFAQGGLTLKHGVLNTLEQAGYVEPASVRATEFALAHHPEREMPANVGVSNPGWWGHVAGSATSSSLPALAAGAATAAVTGGASVPVTASVFGATFLQTFGDIGDQIDKEVGDSVDPMEKFGAQMYEAVVSSFIEAGLGVEAGLSREIGKAALIQTLKKAGGTAMLKELGEKALGRSVFRYGRGLTGFAGQAVGEGVEEVLQKLTHDIGVDVIGNKKFSDFDEYVQAFVQGTAGGAFLSGGMGIMGMANRRALSRLGDPLTDDKVNSVHTKWVDGAKQYDPLSRARADLAFQSLQQVYEQSGLFTPEQAGALVTIQRTIAYNVAKEKGIAPERVVDSLKMAFVPEELDQNDVTVLMGLQGDQAKSIAYLNRRFNLNDRIEGVLIEDDARRLARQNERLAKLNPELTDERKARLQERVTLALARMAPPAETPAAEPAEPIPAPRIVTPAEAAAPTVLARLGPVSEAGVPILDEAYLADVENRQAIQQAQQKAQQTIEQAQDGRAKLDARKKAREDIAAAVEQLTFGPTDDAKIAQSLAVTDQLIARMEKRQGKPVEKRPFMEVQILEGAAGQMDDAEATELYVHGAEQPDGSIVTTDRRGNIIVTPPLSRRTGAGVPGGKTERTVEMVGTKRAALAQPEPGKVEPGRAIVTPAEAAREQAELARLNEQARLLAWQRRQDRTAESREIIRGRTRDTRQPVQPAEQPRLVQGTLFQRPQAGQVTPEQDQAYLAAVEAGDMAGAQRMVDEAARQAGYTVGPVWHGTSSERGGFTEFSAQAPARTDAGFYGKGFYFGTRSTAQKYSRDGGVLRKFFLRMAKPDAGVDEVGQRGDTPEVIQQRYRDAGFDGVAFRGNAADSEQEYVVFSPDQIKSADPVTKDDAGNVIPLSQRFNARSPDVRFQRDQQAPAQPGEPAGSAPKGQYFSDYNLAVFYSKADSGTILHEWWHHMMLADLLPGRYMRAMNKAFNGGGEDWTEAGLENAANALIVFVRDGRLPANTEPELAAAFQFTKGVFAETYKRVSLTVQQEAAISQGEAMAMNPDIDRIFGSLMGGNASEAEQVAGQALATATGLGYLGRGRNPALSQMEDEKAKGYATSQPAISDPTALRNWMYRNRWATNDQLDRHAIDLHPELAGTDKPRQALTLQELQAVPRMSQNRFDLRRELLAEYGVKNEAQLSPEAYERFQTTLEYLDRNSKPSKRPALPPIDQTALQSVLDHMAGLPDTDSLRATAAGGPVRLQNLKNGLRKLGRAGSKMMTDLGNLFYYMNGFSHEGPFTEVFGNRIDEMRRANARLHEDDNARLVRRGEELGAGLDNTMHLMDEVYLGGKVWHKQDALRISRIARNEARRQALLLSNRDVTEKVIADANAVVAGDKKLQAISTLLDEEYARKWALVDPVYARISGKPLGKVENYEPLQRADSSYADHDELNRLIVEELGGLSVVPMKSRTPSQLKTMKQLKGAEIELGDPLKALRQYQESVNAYISKAEGVRDLVRIVDTDEMRDMMGLKYGEDMNLWWTLDNLLRTEMFPGGRGDPMRSDELWAQNARLQFAPAILGLRLPTMLAQPTSVVAQLGEVPGGLVRNILRSAKYFAKFSDVLYRGLRYGEGDKTLLQGTRTYELIDKYAPWIWDRHGGEPIVQEVDRKGMRGLARSIRVGGRPIGEVALRGMMRFDLWAVAVGFQTAYDAAYEIEMNRHGDPLKAERQAASFATKMIRDYQNPSIVQESNYLQRSNEWLKGMMPFSGQPQKMFQGFQYKILMPLAHAYKTGGLVGAGRALFERQGDYGTTIAQRAVMMGAIPSLLLGMIARRRLPDPTEFWQDLVTYPITTIPVIGPAFVYAVTSSERNPNFTPVYLQFVSTFTKVASDVSNGEFDLTGRSGSDAVRAAAMATGLPEIAGQFMRITARKLWTEKKDLADLGLADYAEMMSVPKRAPRD